MYIYQKFRKTLLKNLLLHQSKIDKSDTQYFIATNIIVNKKQTIPIINIENDVSKPIKFKLLIRKYCKKEFNRRVW